jgi:hypothetical protein
MRGVVPVAVAAFLLAACSGDDADPAPDDTGQSATEEARPLPLEPLPEVDETTFPTWAHGLRRSAVVDVPADGAWHPLDVADAELLPELAWVLSCDPESRPASGVREGGDLQLRGSGAESPTVLSCSPVGPWAGAVRGVLPQGSAQVEVRAAHGGAGEVPVRLGVYEPVGWGSYPFEDSAPDLFGDRPQWLADGDELGGDSEAVVREVAALTADDLTAGVASVEVPSAQDLVVQVEVQGPGRIRLAVDGEPLEPWAGGDPQGPQLVLAEPREGWLANWSEGRAHWEVSPLFGETPSGQWGRAERDGAVLTVEAEGFEGGGLTVTVLEAVVVDPS